MRVLFDGYWWHEGPIANANVQRDLIRSWIDTFPEDEVAVVVRAGVDISTLNAQRLESKSNSLAKVNYLELPRLAQAWRADVVITHNFAAPGKKFRSVVFIHDLMFLSNPEWFTAKENLYFRMMPIMSKFAHTVFTSSKTEADRMSVALNREVLPVGLTYASVFDEVTPLNPNLGLLPKKFLLAVGRLNKRKNLNNSIEGALLSGVATPNNPLVVVGESSGKGQHFSKYIQESVLDGSVLFAGKLSTEELAWLYINTERFVFLSLNEGFGLPIVEAIRFGTPIVASDIEVFRELLGESALFVDPTNLLEISTAFQMPPIKPPSVSSLSTWPSIVSRMRESIA